MIFFNRKIKKFADKKKVRGLTLRKKDKVYFLQRILNIRIIFIWITWLSNKLNFAKLKSFKILKVLEPVMYKLNLSDSIKIIRIKHILVLKLADPEAPLIKDILNINSKS